MAEEVDWNEQAMLFAQAILDLNERVTELENTLDDQKLASDPDLATSLQQAADGDTVEAF